MSARGDRVETSEVLQQFEQIEQEVDELIRVIKTLEAENSKLTRENERLTQKLNVKNEAEEQYASEKDMIRTRIDNLLVKLKDVTEVK